MGSAPRYEWTDESIEYLCLLKLRRYSHKKIALKMTSRLHIVISKIMIDDIWNRLIECGYFEDKPEFTAPVNRTLKNRTRDNVAHCPRRASIMHLIDLKRAGHSPTKTELKIESDFWPKRLVESNDLRSYTGSHAAMCAMEA